MKSHLIACIVAVGSCAAVAAADTFNFTSVQVANNNVGSQLGVTVTAASNSSSVVDFTFRNNVGVASRVAEIYFHAGTSIAEIAIVGTQPTGVNYALGNTRPANLPSGNTVGFQTSRASVTGVAASVDANGASALNAAAESLTLRLTFVNRTFADVLASLNAATQTSWLRIGMHVTAIASYNGSSLSFVNTTPPPPPPPLLVPLPAAAYPGMATIAGVAGLGYLRRRRANQA